MKHSALREVSNARECILLQLMEQPTQEVVGSSSGEVIQAEQQQEQE